MSNADSLSSHVTFARQLVKVHSRMTSLLLENVIPSIESFLSDSEINGNRTYLANKIRLVNFGRCKQLKREPVSNEKASGELSRYERAFDICFSRRMKRQQYAMLLSVRFGHLSITRCIDAQMKADALEVQTACS